MLSFTHTCIVVSALTRCPTSVHMRHLGVCSCDCVFVDVGLNDGSTLFAWPQTASHLTKMTAGTQRRDRRVPGLRWHLRKQPETRARLRRCVANATATACYYGFEANARFAPQLEELQQRRRSQGYRVKLFTSTAFATAEGTLRLSVDQSAGHLGSGIEGCASPTSGSHLMTHQVAAGGAASAPASKVVRAVDAAHFLASVAAPEFTGLLAAKIDIEGCEYTVVPHILSVLCATPRGRAELLAIEWHPPHGGVANFSAGQAPVPEHHTHPAVRLSRQLEAPDCNIVSLAWV